MPVGGSGKRAVLKCGCCGGGCEWCCLPMDFSHPEYPKGVFAPIPYQIITGCSELDGFATFAPVGPEEQCDEYVMFYVHDKSYFTTSAKLYIMDLPSGDVCPSTPCSSPIDFILECTPRFAVPGEDKKCDRLFLWVGSYTWPLSGSVPGLTPFGSYDPLNRHWLRIRPSHCVCEGGASGASIRFPLNLSFDNSTATIGVNGACAGLPIGSCVWSCNGELVI